MTLRGFEKVNVSNSKNRSVAAHGSDLSLLEIGKFETFLNKHLTKPRVVVPPPVGLPYYPIFD